MIVIPPPASILPYPSLLAHPGQPRRARPARRRTRSGVLAGCRRVGRFRGAF